MMATQPQQVQNTRLPPWPAALSPDALDESSANGHDDVADTPLFAPMPALAAPPRDAATPPPLPSSTVTFLAPADSDGDFSDDEDSPVVPVAQRRNGGAPSSGSLATTASDWAPSISANVVDAEAALGAAAADVALVGRGAAGAVFRVELVAGHVAPAALTTAGWTLARRARMACMLPAVAAMKLPRDGPGSADDEREAALLPALSHPGVVRYFGRHAATGALLVEHCGGGDLHALVADRGNAPLPEAQVWAVVVQVARALRYLHDERGVVHRDVKPRNVLVRGDGSVALCDFGVAAQGDASAGGAHAAAPFAGTAGYAAPEVLDRAAFDGRADVFGLGCVAHELMTGGRRAFPGRSVAEIFGSMCGGARAALTPAETGYSTALCGAVEAMLEPEAAERPTAAELLERVIPQTLVGVGAATSLLPQHTTAEVPTQETDSPPRPPTRRRL